MATLPKVVRQRSVELLSANRSSNKFIRLRDTLRRFSFEQNQCPKMAREQLAGLPNWTLKADRLALVDVILALFKEARELFMKGPRLIRLSAPLYIFG